MSLNSIKELTPIVYDSSGIKIINFTVRAAHNQMLFPLHWHERMELILVTKGSVLFRVNQHEITLVPNQILIIPPKFVHHGISIEPGATYVTLMFDLRHLFNNLLITKQLIAPLLNKKVSLQSWTDSPEVVCMMKELLEYDSKNDLYSPLSKIGKLYELIAALFRHCLSEEEETHIASDNQLHDVINYINEHFCEKISTATISQQFGYSEGYFCRQFKSITGFSPMIFIRVLRLEKACKLLREQKLSIAQITTECGFEDVSYFTKCFKQQYSITPGKFALKYGNILHDHK